MVRQLSARAQVIVAAAATCGVAVLAAALTLMPSPAAAKARSKRPKRKRKKNDKNDSLSSRGSRLTRPALPYMGGVLEGFAEPYDGGDGQGRDFASGRGEQACWPRLKLRVEAALAQVPDWTANYGPMDGQAAEGRPGVALGSAHHSGRPAARFGIAPAPRAPCHLNNLFYDLRGG